jgi:hypothetical protein
MHLYVQQAMQEVIPGMQVLQYQALTLMDVGLKHGISLIR